MLGVHEDSTCADVFGRADKRWVSGREVALPLDSFDVSLERWDLVQHFEGRNEGQCALGREMALPMDSFDVPSERWWEQRYEQTEKR